jgi:hypothetical protein
MIASRRVVLAALAAGSRLPGTVPPAVPSAAAMLTRDQVVARYGHLRPTTWGFGGPGVVRDLNTARRVIALTLVPS